jgi:serine/threonine protein kinase
VRTGTTIDPTMTGFFSSKSTDAACEGAPSAGVLLGGKYRLSHKLADGAMGAIWEARDESLDRPVAVKLLPPSKRPSAAEWHYLSRRLLREAEIASSIRHPAIVRAFDFGVAPTDEPYYAMELLVGKSLDRIIQRRRPIAPERAVELLLPIAEGLSAVHAVGVVHRDVKPDNIFIAWGPDATTHPKLIDFGVAKVVTPRAEQLTGSGVIGTPEYMAPEQALNSSDVDARADVWGFCVVLYEAVSGTVPFPGQTCTDVLCGVLEREVPPLTGRMGLDVDLWGIIERGLRRERSTRWSGMRELGSALTSWLALHEEEAASA